MVPERLSKVMGELDQTRVVCMGTTLIFPPF